MYPSLGVRPAESVGKRSRRGAFNGTVIALGVTSFFTDISSEMVAAVIPLFLTIQLGFSPAAFGLFQGAYELANASLRLVGGAIADRTRRPKETAAAGYGISTVTRLGLIASAFGGVTPVPFLIADRLGKGLRTGPRDAMISLATPEPAWGTAFGIHRTMDAAGAMLGPLIAGAVLVILPGSFDSIFVLSFGFGLLGFSVVATKVHNPAEVVSAPPQRIRAAFRVHMANVGFRRMLVLGFAFGLFTVGDSFVYLIIWNEAQDSTEIGASGFGIQWFPLLFAGTAMVFLLVATPFGHLSDRIGRARVWALGHGFLLAVYLLLLVGPATTTANISVLVLLGFYYGATDGALPALASGVIPAELRSGGLAMLATAVAVARMVAAVGFGLTWNSVGSDRALMVAIVGLGFVLFTVSATAVLRTNETG